MNIIHYSIQILQLQDIREKYGSFFLSCFHKSLTKLKRKANLLLVYCDKSVESVSRIVTIVTLSAWNCEQT